MKNKKAVSGTNMALLTVILAVAVAIVLFSFSNLFAEEVEKKGDIEVCRLNVIATHLSIHNPAAAFGETVPVSQCTTKDMGELKLSKEIRAEKQKGYITSQVAKSYRDCWYKFVEGTKDPWPAYYTQHYAGCFACSMFKLPDGIEISEDEFREFIGDKYSPYLDNAGIRAADGNDYYFIDSIGLKGGWWTLGAVKPDAISTYDKIYPPKEYAVVYWHMAGKRLKDAFSWEGGSYSFITITPLSKTKDLGCEFTRINIKE